MNTPIVFPKGRLHVGLMFCVLFCCLIAPAYGRQDTSDVSPDSVASEPAMGVPDAMSQADSMLAGKLRRAIATLDGFSNVEIEVKEGVVKLSGEVVDAAERERAAELAAAFPGTVYVINNLQNDVEVEARVAPAIDRVQQYINDAIAYLPVLAIALMILLLFGFIASFVEKLLPSFSKMGLSQMAGNLTVRLVRAFLWLVGLVLALDILGITALVGAVLGTAGLMGIAIGFAFQDIIENYLAGLLLSVRHPFSLNDHVKVGGEEGKVVRLTSRELVLMTLDGNHVRIPNAQVFKSTIYNYSRNPRRRFTFEAGVDVEEDLQRVQRIGIDTLLSMESVMKAPKPFSLVRELGDFNVLVAFYGWVDQTQADFSKARSEAIRLVKNALDDAGVLMPEPIYNIRMQTVSKDLSSDARDRMKKPPAIQESTREGDVAVESDIEEQIEDDLRASDEPNLLSQETES